MILSPREREVLNAIAECSSIAVNELSAQLRMESDEVEIVAGTLRAKGAVNVCAGPRSAIATITSRGRLALNEHDRRSTV